LFQNFSLT